MKIGKFAEMYGVSVDTVRFYIENGLLIPEKIHNQYEFDEKCSRDLENILELKDMKFTLSEIRKILSFRKLGNLFDKKDLEFYKNFFKKKYEELLDEKKNLNDALSLIEKKLETIDETDSSGGRGTGFPFHFLKNLACPDCLKELSMDKVTVENNMIYEASLSCDCGYAASIKEGILVTPSARYDYDEIDDSQGKTKRFLDDYGSTYVNFLSKPVEWIKKRFVEEKIESPTVLELGTGKGFFLSCVMENLKKGTTYIATDISYSRVAPFKELLQNCPTDADIIFILGDFARLPLKKDSVDIVLDVYGSGSFVPEFGEYPYGKVINRLKSGGKLLGAYLYGEPDSFEWSYKSNWGSLFYLPNVQAALKDFEKIESSKLGGTKANSDIGLVKEGTPVYMWAYAGRKKDQY